MRVATPVDGVATPSGRPIMRTTLIASLALLALVGCTSPQAIPPTPIPRTESPVDPVVDLDHLPELTAPQTCAGHVALTFDDGPTDLTLDILAVLDHYDVPAAFFNIGVQEESHARVVEHTVAAGHQLGNHTQTHADLLTLGIESALAEIDAATVTHRDLGHRNPRLFRPPFGNTSPELRTAVESRGMVEVLWTVDSKDYQAQSAEQVVEASKGMTDGGILLMHDGKPHTLEALPSIIGHYYDQGLCFGQIAVADTELPTDLGFTHRVRASEQES